MSFGYPMPGPVLMPGYKEESNMIPILKLMDYWGRERHILGTMIEICIGYPGTHKRDGGME